jgi:hypothetical protein
MRFFDRVRDTSVTTGSSGDFTLGLAGLNGYSSFASRYATGERVPYCAVQQSTALNEWEVGWGTMSSTAAIARTNVYASSNSDAAVNFSAGTKDIFVPDPANYLRQTRSASQIMFSILGMDYP